VSVLESHLGDERLRLVDVGARGGIAPRWEPFTTVLDVTAFEPEPDECERLNRAADSLPYPIRYLPVALGKESRDAVPLHVTNWPVASSVNRPNEEFLRSFPEAERLFSVRQVEAISVTTLDDVAEREGLGADCLKVDVEGAALDVLIGAERTLREALMLEVEAELNPLFTGEALFPAVDSHLRERGWVLQGIRRTSWRRGGQLDPSRSGLGGQIVQLDALYCNDELIGRDLSLARELKLLAMLAAYHQADAVNTRLEGLRQGDAMSDGAIDELKRLLIPRPSPVRRLMRRALGGSSSARRRAIADQLQRGDATVWEDPHFF
jgi:FkbM family methyltransferase